MGMEAVIARQIDGQLYAPGNFTTMREGIRRFKERPAIAAGARVFIERLAFVDRGVYTLTPRVLVSTGDGATRWIDAAKVVPVSEAAAAVCA